MQKDSFAKSTPLAMEGVRCLQEAFLKEFGFRPRVGMELEYSLSSKDPPGVHELLQLDPNAKNKITSRRFQSSGDSIVVPKYFENSPYVVSHYKESGINKYEVVFGHEQDHGDLRVLCRAVEAAKTHIMRYAENMGLQATFQPYIQIENEKGYFKDSTNSLQASISLENQGGENILSEDRISASTQDTIVNAMVKDLKANFLLVAAERPMYERFAKGLHAPPRFRNAQYDQYGAVGYYPDAHGDNRIEMRLASADTPAAFVMLTTLCALYVALHDENLRITKGQRIEMPHPKIVDKDDLGPIPEEIEPIIAEFERTNTVHQILDGISEDKSLGSRLQSTFLAEVHEAMQSSDRSVPAHTR